VSISGEDVDDDRLKAGEEVCCAPNGNKNKCCEDNLISYGILIFLSVVLCLCCCCMCMASYCFRERWADMPQTFKEKGDAEVATTRRNTTMTGSTKEPLIDQPDVVERGSAASPKSSVPEMRRDDDEESDEEIELEIEVTSTKELPMAAPVKASTTKRGLVSSLSKNALVLPSSTSRAEGTDEPWDASGEREA
jgi:hypothetical protein